MIVNEWIFFSSFCLALFIGRAASTTEIVSNQPNQPKEICATNSADPTVKESGVTQSPESVMKKDKNWAYFKDYTGPIINVYQCVPLSYGKIFFVFSIRDKKGKTTSRAEPGYDQYGCVHLTQTDLIDIECEYTIDPFNSDCIRLQIRVNQKFADVFVDKTIKLEIQSSTIASTSKCVFIRPLILEPSYYPQTAKEMYEDKLNNELMSLRSLYKGETISEKETKKNKCVTFYTVGAIVGSLITLILLTILMPITYNYVEIVGQDELDSNEEYDSNESITEEEKEVSYDFSSQVQISIVKPSSSESSYYGSNTNEKGTSASNTKEKGTSASYS